MRTHVLQSTFPALLSMILSLIQVPTIPSDSDSHDGNDAEADDSDGCAVAAAGAVARGRGGDGNGDGDDGDNCDDNTAQLVPLTSLVLLGSPKEVVYEAVPNVDIGAAVPAAVATAATSDSSAVDATANISAGIVDEWAGITVGLYSRIAVILTVVAALTAPPNSGSNPTTKPNPKSPT